MQKVISLLMLTNILILFACQPIHKQSEIVSAMERYDRLLLKMNPDSISAFYTPDGSLGDIAIGQDSIKKFLSSFKNIKIIEQKSTTTSIEIKGNAAIQKGDYFQKDIISNRDTVTVKGQYIVNWEWQKGSGWLIKKMITNPTK